MVLDDGAYATFGGQVFKQVIGFPQGTNTGSALSARFGTMRGVS